MKQYPTTTKGSKASQTNKKTTFDPKPSPEYSRHLCGMRNVDKVRLSFGRNESQMEIAKSPTTQ